MINVEFSIKNSTIGGGNTLLKSNEMRRDSGCWSFVYVYSELQFQTGCRGATFTGRRNPEMTAILGTAFKVKSGNIVIVRLLLYLHGTE